MEANILRGVVIEKATSLRIPKEERDDEKFYYDVRHSDDCGFTPATIERFVMVNHMGTIVTNEPLDLGDDGYIILTEDEEGIVLRAF